jgi:WD40 repeat protein
MIPRLPRRGGYEEATRRRQVSPWNDSIEEIVMNGSVNLDEASQPCFDASSSKLAWGSLDGRLRLFDVNSQQIVADITQDVSDSSIAGKSISKSVYSCLGWGQGKVRFGKMASMRGMQHCSTAALQHCKTGRRVGSSSPSAFGPPSVSAIVVVVTMGTVGTVVVGTDVIHPSTHWNYIDSRCRVHLQRFCWQVPSTVPCSRMTRQR